MLQLNNVTYDVVDRRLFSNLNFSFTAKKYGLVGPNGVGKSTLAKLMAKQIEPTQGSIQSSQNAVLFLQEEERTRQTVSEYLIDFWQSQPPSYAYEMLATLRLEATLNELSGGEWMRARLLKLISSRATFVILDEPTNNLDQAGRAVVNEFVRHFAGTLVVISHDRQLLSEVDTILELSNQGLSVYGGDFNFYWRERENERERLDENLQIAKNEAQRKKSQTQEKIERQEKRMRTGQAAADRGGMPKILIGARKRKAQKSMGKIKVQTSEAESVALAEADLAWQQMKLDPFVRFDFASAKPAAGKNHFVAEDLNFSYTSMSNLWKHPLNFIIRGSEKWRIQGLNGSGKSTLIQLLLGRSLQGEITGAIRSRAQHIAYLDQRYGLLNKENTVLEDISEDSRFTIEELRNELAFFGFRKESVNQKISSLSGGEILKATLAKAFLAKALPEVLILDEPTNNLDLQGQELLATAVEKFAGAVIIVSHDEGFVEKIGVNSVINL